MPALGAPQALAHSGLSVPITLYFSRTPDGHLVALWSAAFSVFHVNRTARSKYWPQLQSRLKVWIPSRRAGPGSRPSSLIRRMQHPLADDLAGIDDGDVAVHESRMLGDVVCHLAHQRGGGQASLSRPPRHETKLTPDEIIFPFFEAMPKLAKVKEALTKRRQGRAIVTRRWSCLRRASG
jgi:hypothetical protein